MGLALDFNIRQSDNARELSFKETTGVYHVTDNPGGWGAPNDTTSDPTGVLLKITTPDGNQTTLDLSATFPTTDNTQEYLIHSQDLGLGTDVKLPDGIWDFEYEIDTPGEPAFVRSIQRIFISGNARCCVYNLLASVDLCDCDGSDLARALEAYTYYRVAVACAFTGNEDHFTDALNLINKYCNGC